MSIVCAYGLEPRLNKLRHRPKYGVKNINTFDLGIMGYLTTPVIDAR